MSGKEASKNNNLIQQKQTAKPEKNVVSPTTELTTDLGELSPLATQPAEATPHNAGLRNQQVHSMQNTFGNSRLQRALAPATSSTARPGGILFPTVQRQMEVSEEGDELEEEADEVASQVMRQGMAAAAPAGEDNPEDEDNNLNIQAKMQVNEPNDPYEQEADAVAAQVMRMSDDEAEDTVNRQPLIQRQVQRAGVSTPEVTPDIEQGVNSLQSGGSPLPDTERSFFESRMGADFSNVRIHNDSKASNLSNDLQARAFTVGHSIAFNEGEYQPGSSSGRELLAHELTHVVQQGSAPQLKRLPNIQRDGGDGTTGEAPTPTPEEKAAAAAAAAAAEAIAAEAKATGESEKVKSQGEAQTEQTAGEAPSAEAAASKAKGPVSDEVEKARQQTDAETITTATAEKVTKETAAQEVSQVKQQQVAAEASVANSRPKGNGTAPAAPSAQPAGGGGGGLETATATAQAAVSGAFEASLSSPDKAPATPEQDTANVAAVESTKAAGEKERTHGPASGEASEAQAASVSPQAELTGQAQAVQVGQTEQTETPAFDGAAFKAQLMERITSLTPSTAEEADEFKESGTLDGVKSDMQGQVDTERTASQGPLEEKAAAEPNLADATPKPVTPLVANDPGANPGEVGAEQAVPKAKGTGEVETPLQDSSKALDQQMADAEITDEQLANSNEPAFTSALESKNSAQTEVAAAPAAYRQFETDQLTQAQAEAVAATQAGLEGMHGDRANALLGIDQEQAATKTEDEQKREQIAADINTIYGETKTNVENILSTLDDEVNRVFDEGAAAAKQAFEDYVDAKMEAYKEERYGGWLGWAQWIADKVMGMPGEVNTFYAEGRELYIGKMDAVIDNVIAIIGTTLAEAKAEVGRGKSRIQTYVDQLPEDCRQMGLEAQQDIQGQFDQLEQTINNKQNELVDSLAQKYVENLQAVDARIEEMKAANRGLVDMALEAIGGVIQTIIELKNLLMDALANAASAITVILQDPIGFVSNLISAVRLGLNNFVSNIATHLQTGFVEWLTGTMGEAGIQMPENIFSLEGVLDLTLQILGLTWENFRARAVGIFGENIVAALETGFEIFVVLQQEGIMGLWEWIKDKLTDLKDQVIDGIKEMLITEVVEAGITWIIGLIGGPAGAFIKAVQTIVNVVMWFIDNAERIASLINAISQAVVDIAAGNLTGAAQYVEDALARFVPVAIGFLASLLGLGDLSTKVRRVIDRIQAPVNNAIDSVLTMIRDFVMKIAKMLGFSGGGGKPGGEIGEEMQFSADGESHRLFVDVQGSQATLKVASEEMTLLERLAKWETMLNTPATDDSASVPEDKKAQALPLIGQARGLLTGAEESADYLAQKKEAVKKVDEGPKIEEEQGELVQEQTSLTDVLKQLFEILGEKMPEWKGEAQTKFSQIMGDIHIPSAVKSRFENEALEGLFNLGEEAEGTQQLDMLKRIVGAGNYVAQGPDIPESELEAKGGMTRVIPLETIFNENLAADYKAQFADFNDWLDALGEDLSVFDPNSHLNSGSSVPGQYATAWWSPRDQQQGNTMAELIGELALNPGRYRGGCVRVTVSPEAGQVAGFKKPTALDGIFFAEFALAPDSPWGITGGGSLEAVAPQIMMSDITEKEFMPHDLPTSGRVETKLKEKEQPLLTPEGKISEEDAKQAAETTAQEKGNVQITVQESGETWKYNIQRADLTTPKADELPEGFEDGAYIGYQSPTATENFYRGVIQNKDTQQKQITVVFAATHLGTKTFSFDEVIQLVNTNKMQAGGSGAKTADDLFAEASDKVQQETQKALDGAVGNAGADWVAVFATTGKQVQVPDRNGGFQPATLGYLLEEMGLSEDYISYWVKVAIEMSVDLPELTHERIAVKQEIEQVAQNIAGSIFSSSRLAFLITPTSIPRNLTVGSGTYVRKNGDVALSNSLYGSTIDNAESDLQKAFGDEVHHVIPLALGGSHHVSNLLSVKGKRSEEVADSAHSGLHSLLDEKAKTSIRVYIDNAQEPPIPIDLSSLDEGALRRAIEAAAKMNVIIGTLFNDGNITYEDTEIVFE